MVFKKSIEAAFPDIKNACAPGKQALPKKDAGKIACEKTMTIRNSVFLDECANTIKEFQQANRWDYGLAVGKTADALHELVVWVEVHGARTGEVDCVMKKREWLRQWLVHHAPELYKSMGHSLNPQNCHWVAENGVHIPENSPQARRLRSKNMWPKKVLTITEKDFGKRNVPG